MAKLATLFCASSVFAKHYGGMVHKMHQLNEELIVMKGHCWEFIELFDGTVKQICFDVPEVDGAKICKTGSFANVDQVIICKEDLGVWTAS